MADLRLSSENKNNLQLSCASLVEAGDGIWVASSNFKIVEKHCVRSAGQTFTLPWKMLGGTKPGRAGGRGMMSA